MSKSIIKKIVIIAVVGVLIGGSYAAYIYFMPHRDIQSVEVFVEIEAAQLVDEYLADASAANEKYLDAEGESKVIIVKGTIKSIDTDQNNQIVAVLKSNNDELGVSCTFTAESNENAASLKVGDVIKVKGVVRSGAEFDEDLDLYEDAIIEKCDLVK
jgi:tRNA_anti-like